MSKTYKLLKDCLDAKAGDIFELDRVNDSYTKIGADCEIDYTSPDFVENNPDWFQEVKTIPDFEIISFKKPPSSFRDYILKKYEDGNYRLEDYTVSFTLDNLLNDKDYSINSVKRTSDGEVFSVGTDTNFGKILGFVILTEQNCNNTVCMFHSGSDNYGKMFVKTDKAPYAYCTKLEELDKAPSRTPLFIDFNGVPVYPGDPYWCVEGNKLWYGGTAGGNSGAGKKIKYFTSEEAAKKHHIPLFTTEDGKGIFEGDVYWSMFPDFSIKKYDAKSTMWFDKNNKRFSTEEEAKEYLLMNKPFLSLKDTLSCFDIDWALFMGKLTSAVKEKLKL